MSITHEKCMKCLNHNDVLLSSRTRSNGFIGLCDHTFCQSCFQKENVKSALKPTYIFTCPCCHARFYGSMQSIDEAILLGEAVTLRTYINFNCVQPNMKITDENITSLHKANKRVIEKLEAALVLNQTNFFTLYLLFLCCSRTYQFLQDHNVIKYPIDSYAVQLVDYSFKLLDHPTIPAQYGYIRRDCYYMLACIFSVFSNYSAAVKYAKLAYEYCLRSSDHTQLSSYKAVYSKYRAVLANLPPLRFAVGDEVEFLLEAGSEWKLGKVVELYYRERGFDIPFTAPYRLQLLDVSDQPPVYAWVKADIDRYVRKVGVRSIEDTRYQARLDAKVVELAQVYCSEVFIQDIYCTLAQDREFVDMLRSVWQIELSAHMLCLYRMLVMYRQPFVRTASGYHVPSSEEVIAEIRAYFDPAPLSGDAVPSAVSEHSDSQRARAQVLCRLRDSFMDKPVIIDDSEVQGLLLASINYYLMVLTQAGRYLDISAGLPDDGYFTAPPEISDGISKVSTKYEIRALLTPSNVNTKVGYLLTTWNGVHACLENPNAGPACECPWIYFLVKYSLDHGAGVPKLALALYDRMNMQLSREFIRCGNPTCELNRLDKSTGQVKFKKCSCCHAVIYCSRECQVTHYPEHKTYCRKLVRVEDAASPVDNSAMDHRD